MAILPEPRGGRRGRPGLLRGQASGLQTLCGDGGLGNLYGSHPWQLLTNRPCPSGSQRPAAPQAQRVKQVPGPERHYWPRVGRCGRGHQAPPSPTWVCAAGAAATRSSAARPGPLCAGRGKEKKTRWGNQQQHQQSVSRVGDRKKRGARAPLCVGAAPFARQLRSRLATEKKEGGSGATGWSWAGGGGNHPPAVPTHYAGEECKLS